MEQFLYTLLGLLFINFVYLFFKFLISINLGVHDNQLFLGYGNHEAFKIKIKKLTIYVGLFIPLPWLAKFYSYDEGKKDRITFEWEFYEKPWGLRLLVIFAGSIGSLLTSMLIYSILSYQQSEQYISKEELNRYGIYPSEFAASSGFKKGDRVLKINGQDFERFEDLLSPLTLLNDLSYYLILRDQDTIELNPDWALDDLSENSTFIFVPNAPHEILAFVEGAMAIESGMREGDIITKIDSLQVNSLQEIGEVLRLYSGDSVTVQVKRDDAFHEVEVEVSKDGKIGFYASSLVAYSSYQKTIYEAVIEGIFKPFDIVAINLKAFARMLGAEVETTRQVSGPVRVANLFGDRNTAQFFRVCALLLAIIPLWDLFPFPKSAALKSIPIISEVFFRKRVTYKLFKRIQKTGWYVIALLMAVTIINDVLSLF